MNRITVLVALVKGMLEGDVLCSQMLRSADYRVVLDSIDEDARHSDAAALAESPPGEPISLIVRAVPLEVSSALKQLKLWLRGAKSAIVCDPYFFFHPSTGSFFTSDADYANRLIDLFDPETKDIQIFCNGYTAQMKEKLWKPLKKGRRVRVFDSKNIHDRFLIKDNSEGKMIGASMQGFGGKIFAVLDLPFEDVTTLLKELRQITKIAIRPLVPRLKQGPKRRSGRSHPQTPLSIAVSFALAFCTVQAQ